MNIGSGESAGSSRGRKGKRRRSHAGNEEVALQITSMADIFTILLVFLLKSYSVSAIDLTVGKDVQIPTARGGTDRVEAMKLQVSENGITIEGNSVLTFTGYAPTAGQIKNGSLPEVIKALGKEREKQKELQKQRDIASVSGQPMLNPDGTPVAAKVFPESQLLIVSDKKVPYKTLKLILASASVQDYTDFKLVVVSED